MKRLYLYLLKNFIGPFVLTFFISIFILLMMFIWKHLDELVGKGLETGIIIELMLYASMGLVSLALPLAVLLASIMTFGNLGERYELLAIKASGVSLLRIMRPLIFFNILLTLFAFYLADQVIPVSNAKFHALLTSVKEQRPEMVLKEGIFSNNIDGYSIKVKGRDPSTKALLDIMIYDHTEEKGNINVTLADSGYLNMSDDKQFMILKLFNGESYTDAKEGERKAKETYPFRREKFDHQEVVISVRDFALNRADEEKYKDYYKMLNNNQLASVIDSLKVTYKVMEQQLTAGMKYNDLLDARVVNNYSPDSLQLDSLLLTRMNVTFDSVYYNLNKISRSSILNTAQQVAQQNQRVILQFQPLMYNRMFWINKHTVEWHKKYNLSLACLLFFFIGAPLGAIIRKGGFGMPVVVSILLFISYYLFSVFGEKMACEGLWKIDMILWVPSVVYLLIGILLTHQAVNDSLLINKLVVSMR